MNGADRVVEVLAGLADKGHLPLLGRPAALESHRLGDRRAGQPAVDHCLHELEVFESLERLRENVPDDLYRLVLEASAASPLEDLDI